MTFVAQAPTNLTHQRLDKRYLSHVKQTLAHGLLYCLVRRLWAAMYINSKSTSGGGNINGMVWLGAVWAAVYTNSKSTSEGGKT